MFLRRFPRSVVLCAAIFLSLFSGAATAATWVGGDGNWDEPGNWRPEVVPGRADTVIIDEGNVELDTSRIGDIFVAGLEIRGDASLRIIGGGRLEAIDSIVVEVSAALISEASTTITPNMEPQMTGRTTRGGGSGILFNPSTLQVGTLSEPPDEFEWHMGLGGNTAASPGNVGPGFYASVSADDLNLGGILSLDLLYGFTPSEGDRFRLFSSINGRSGTFFGLPNGSVVASFGSVDMVIEYDPLGVTVAAVERVTLSAIESTPGIPGLKTPGILFLVFFMGLAVAFRRGTP